MHLGRVVLRLDDPDLHQSRGLHVRREAMEGGQGDVLRGRDNSPHEIDVAVEVAMVHGVDELAAKDAVHVLEVDDHPRGGVERAADRHLDHVVVAVVRGAGAEDLAVLLVAPVVTAQDVSRRKRRAAGDAHLGGHGSIRKLAPDSGADSPDASQTIMRATSTGASDGPWTPAMRSISVSTEPG